MSLTLINTGTADTEGFKLVNIIGEGEGNFQLANFTYLLLAETSDIITAENNLQLEIEHL